MTDQLTNQVSLEDLKRAIAKYQKAVAAYEGNASMGWDIEACRSDAWRAAFMWRETFANLSCERERYGEYLEGTRLIREKLR